MTLEGGQKAYVSAADQHSDTERRAMPDAATIYTLIGRLWHSLGDAKKSVDCYVSAVKLNPYLWEAFLGLCDTGIVKPFRWFAGVNADFSFF